MENNEQLIPKEIVRVSISEAARLFGVNPQTIRRALKNQEVTYVVVAGRYKINFESLVASLNARIRNEEEALYQEYEEIKKK